MDEGEIEALVTPYCFTRLLTSAVGDVNYLVKHQKDVSMDEEDE